MVSNGGLDFSNLARSDHGKSLDEGLGLFALVVVGAVVLVGVAMVATEGVSTVAFDRGETKLLLASRSEALVLLLSEETAFSKRGRRVAW